MAASVHRNRLLPKNKVPWKSLNCNYHLPIGARKAVFFFLQDFNDSPPLVIKNVVVETKQEYKSEAREKLKAENALFYISYEYTGGVGKPGHMCLDVVDRTEEEAE